MKKIIIILVITLSCLFPMRVMAESDSSEKIEEYNTETDEYENVFEALFDKAFDNLPEVLSFVTLCASLILAFTYKRGLLPLVRGSLRAIGDSVARMEAEKDEDGESLRSIEKMLSDGLNAANEKVGELVVQITEMKNSLENAERRAGDRGKLVKLINGQIDMLYDVFMSSSLPHFQKEAVGERIAEMREAIAADDGE